MSGSGAGSPLNVFRETLPENCPAEKDAKEITGPLVVYRLVASDVPCEADFDSHQKKKPDHVYPDPCSFCSVSVYTNRATAVNQSLSARFRKLGLTRICRVELTAGAGMMDAGQSNGHRQWWPYKNYDILSRCEVEA